MSVFIYFTHSTLQSLTVIGFKCLNTFSDIILVQFTAVEILSDLLCIC